MIDPVDMAERHGRILNRLGELGLSLAEDMHACALAVETPKDKAELGLAFHRISRSVRQTLALEAKLERDRHRQDREGRADAVREQQARVSLRKAQVKAAVERAIWSEVEGDEAERLVDDLADFLDEEALSNDFTSGPLDAHIARIRAEFGLSPSAGMSGTGDAIESDPDRPARRSSG